jgi:hypothetical protein
MVWRFSFTVRRNSSIDLILRAKEIVASIPILLSFILSQLPCFCGVMDSRPFAKSLFRNEKDWVLGKVPFHWNCFPIPASRSRLLRCSSVVDVHPRPHHALHSAPAGSAFRKFHLAKGLNRSHSLRDLTGADASCSKSGGACLDCPLPTQFFSLWQHYMSDALQARGEVQSRAPRILSDEYIASPPRPQHDHTASRTSLSYFPPARSRSRPWQRDRTRVGMISRLSESSCLATLSKPPRGCDCCGGLVYTSRTYSIVAKKAAFCCCGIHQLPLSP